MRFRPKQRRRLAFWLLVVAIITVWVLAWPTRQPIHDTLDHLGSLGYQCAKQPERKSIYVCTDKAGGDPTDPKTKTTLWLYSPYEVAEAEQLMDNHCPKFEPLWQTGLSPQIWEIDRQVIVMPHELYSQADMLDQYPARQARLDLALRQIPTFSMAIDLDTRCQWYTQEPGGGSLI